MHKLLCKFGIHTYGEMYLDRRQRHIGTDNGKIIPVYDHHIKKQCILCKKIKNIVSIFAPK